MTIAARVEAGLAPAKSDHSDHLPASAPRSDHAPGRAGMTFRQTIIWSLLAALIGAAIVDGLALRRWVWDITDPLRFIPDTRRHCFWALETSGPEGLLNQYDKMVIQTRDWDWFLDYVPLRLLVMQRWGVYLRSHFPEVNNQRPDEAYQRSYEFTAPLLFFNASMDALAAACAFLLTRLWIRRSAAHPAHFAGVWQGLVAAALIWFNPAILLSAYVWPTWDSWIIPMFLLTALLASLDLWFCSGIALAIGAMLKGQQLAVASVFVMWPLLQCRFGAAARWCIGLLFGMAIIASPWLLSYIPPDQLAAARQIQESLSPEQYPPRLFAMSRAIDAGAVAWIVGLLLAAISLRLLRPKISFFHRRRFISVIAIFAIIILAVIWPWLLARNRATWPIGLSLGVILAATTTWLRPSRQRFVLAAALGISLLLCMSLFNAGDGWWHCGFVFGASRWHWFAETLTDNLPGLLLEGYHWSKNPDVIVWTLPAIARHWPTFLTQWEWWPAVDLDVTAKMFANATYAPMLLLSGIGISLQARRKNRRVLVALVTPWIVFFLFPAEIHGRYILFSAGVSAICIGESVGMALMSLFLTAVATITILNDLMEGGDVAGWGSVLSSRYPNVLSPQFAEQLYRFVNGTHPHLAWAMFVVTGTFLYLSLARSPKHISHVEAP